MSHWQTVIAIDNDPAPGLGVSIMITTPPHPAPPALKRAAAAVSARHRRISRRNVEAALAKQQAHVLSDVELERLKGDLKNRIWILE